MGSKCAGALSTKSAKQKETKAEPHSFAAFLAKHANMYAKNVRVVASVGSANQGVSAGGWFEFDSNNPTGKMIQKGCSKDSCTPMNPETQIKK